jgi:hypothetical protein
MGHVMDGAYQVISTSYRSDGYLHGWARHTDTALEAVIRYDDIAYSLQGSDTSCAGSWSGAEI